MKMNPDDPRLTAFALDELEEPERSTMARELAESPDARRFVDETRELASALKNEFSAELQNEATPPANLIDIRDDPWFWSTARRLALAAAIVVAAIIAGVVFPNRETEIERVVVTGSEIPTAEEVGPDPVEAEVNETAPASPVVTQNSPAASMQFEVRNGRRSQNVAKKAAKPLTQFRAAIAATPSGPMVSGGAEGRIEDSDRYAGIREQSGEFNTAAYDHIVENPFLDAKSNPLSTFSIDVDTASYSNVRRFINAGSLPPKDAVRVEEMINYFTYDYPQPTTANRSPSMSMRAAVRGSRRIGSSASD